MKTFGIIVDFLVAFFICYLFATQGQLFIMVPPTVMALVTPVFLWGIIAAATGNWNPFIIAVGVDRRLSLSKWQTAMWTAVVLYAYTALFAYNIGLYVNRAHAVAAAKTAVTNAQEALKKAPSDPQLKTTVADAQKAEQTAEQTLNNLNTPPPSETGQPSTPAATPGTAVGSSSTPFVPIDFPATVLLLLGFSVTTLIGASGITSSQVQSNAIRKTPAKTLSLSPKWLVTDDTGATVDLTRLQNFMWTIISIGVFLTYAWTECTILGDQPVKSLPDIGMALVLLMGLGQATYLGGKLMLNNKPAIQRLSASEGAPGQPVTIVGMGFGDKADTSMLFLDNFAIPTTNWTNASINFTVPAADPAIGTPWPTGLTTLSLAVVVGSMQSAPVDFNIRGIAAAQAPPASESSSNSLPVPTNYSPLPGSRRRAAPGTTFIKPADPVDQVQVTIVLRRRPDGEPLPDFGALSKVAPADRTRLSEGEFAAKYGADPGDVRDVEGYVTAHGLTVDAVNLASRTVRVSGTVQQMEDAFGVVLGHYQLPVTTSPSGSVTQPQQYRGRDGNIYVPSNLVGIIIGVFGLDNRPVTKRNAAGVPLNTTPLSVPEFTRLYNFPTNAATGQTIAILSEAGYQLTDIQTYFAALKASMPTITDIAIDGVTNDLSADRETTLDICIAASAAPGAAIAVYFKSQGESGWVDLINRVIHPQAGDPVCSVLSSSYYVANGDDAATLAAQQVSTSWLNTVSMAFQDAALQHVTICIASGDAGTQSMTTDNQAHVQYPASDPWVLAVGGTTICNVNGASYDEYIWSDDRGATGGGISDYFALPDYQQNTGVPASVNPDGRKGRGVPDVAANASLYSGYWIILGGGGTTGGGTSASAPLWAGLIAVLNGALGGNLGFVNPAFYAIGSKGFRPIGGSPGPVDNGFGGVTGYPAGSGWDACTGWGSIDGEALLAALKQHSAAPVASAASQVIA